MYGNYSAIIKDALKHKGHKNLHIFNFEDSKANPELEISKLDEFLGTNLSKEQISNVSIFSLFFRL